MSRIENDFLGDLEVPDDCYYGVQTLRGKQNLLCHRLRLCQEGCRHGQQGTRHDSG